MIAPGTRVTWHDHATGTRRIGTVAAVRQSRRGPVYRVHEGDGSTSEPATYAASRNARGVLDFPGDVLAPYARRWWPNPTPGGAALPYDPGAPCDECGEPAPGINGHDPDCPTYDEDSREVLPEPVEATAPPLPPLVFIEPRDLVTDAPGDGPPLALF